MIDYGAIPSSQEDNLDGPRKRIHSSKTNESKQGHVLLLQVLVILSTVCIIWNHSSLSSSSSLLAQSPSRQGLFSTVTRDEMKRVNVTNEIVDTEDEIDTPNDTDEMEGPDEDIMDTPSSSTSLNATIDDTDEIEGPDEDVMDTSSSSTSLNATIIPPSVAANNSNTTSTLEDEEGPDHDTDEIDTSDGTDEMEGPDDNVDTSSSTSLNATSITLEDEEGPDHDTNEIDPPDGTDEMEGPDEIKDALSSTSLNITGVPSSTTGNSTSSTLDNEHPDHDTDEGPANVIDKSSSVNAISKPSSANISIDDDDIPDSGFSSDYFGGQRNFSIGMAMTFFIQTLVSIVL